MKNASPGYNRDGIILSQVQPTEYAAFATEQLLSTYVAATPSLYTIDRSALLHRYQRLALPLASGRSLPSILLTYARWNTRAATNSGAVISGATNPNGPEHRGFRRSTGVPGGSCRIGESRGMPAGREVLAQLQYPGIADPSTLISVAPRQRRPGDGRWW